MPYDLFISYAHQGDNTSREAVAALARARRGNLPGRTHALRWRQGTVGGGTGA